MERPALTLWTSAPAATEDELRLLAALAAAGRGRREEVAVEGPRGRRPVGVRLSLVVEEPLDGSAQVGSRLSWAGEPPGDDERPAEDLWDLVDRFLRSCQEEARGAVPPPSA